MKRSRKPVSAKPWYGRATLKRRRKDLLHDSIVSMFDGALELAERDPDAFLRRGKALIAKLGEAVHHELDEMARDPRKTRNAAVRITARAARRGLKRL